MKVLFAVSNENVSETIVKKYQKEYKEIVSYKNVYYFNAIIKEMQRDKSYDRIVISEDLEPFANNNYDTIDKFLFDKLDSISDEATDNGEKEAQIILICSDRRSKSDALLVKLFGIGIYSAIIGRDRSVEEVCRLINNPRTKKEAKIYYRIESDEVSYQAENDTDVNENEIQSILKHYKTLGKNEEKYVESFNNIASQYTDAQLRIIIKFLPLNVKAVLEAKSPKYQEVVMFGDKQYKRNNTSNVGGKYTTKNEKTRKKTSEIDESLKIDSIEKRVNNPLTGRPIIIPSVVKKEKAIEVERELQELEQRDNRIASSKTVTPEPQFQEIQQISEIPQVESRKGRGRPKKIVEEQIQEENIDSVKKGRGRPKKTEKEEDINLFAMGEKKEQNNTYESKKMIEDSVILPGVEESKNVILPGLEDVQQQLESEPQDVEMNKYSTTYTKTQDNYIEKRTNEFETESSYDLESVLTGDKKIVAFVGTTKNGTSFIVNNLAALFSQMGINTAILDTTENRNSYYIYTKNEEELRKVAYNSIQKLKEGIANGVRVDKNLSVYTSLPGEMEERENISSILKTLVSKHNLVLIDCDFNTPAEYFEKAQEIYLIQSMDVLTIQPLTAFLRDLKNKEILKPEKLRIVINKATKIRGLNERVLIGGMAYYNSPSMSFMTELFNKDMIKFCEIPLDTNTYISYLEAMVSCEISLNRYSKLFMIKLKELAAMVYPLLNKKPYQPREIRQNQTQKNYFSSSMNSTLEQMNKMKNRY